MVQHISGTRGVFRESPLHHAIRTGDEEMTFLMIGKDEDNKSESGIDRKLPTVGSSPSSTAVKLTNRMNNKPSFNKIRGFDHSLRKSPRIPPDLNLKDGNSRSVVHLAAMSRSKTILEAVLSYKECENLVFSKDIKENTPLHLLFWDTAEGVDEDSLIECVDILLSYGIDINSLNIKHQTPLFAATRRKLSEVVLYLLRKGADSTTITTDGWSVLHAACNAGCAKCLKHLLDTGAVGDLIHQETVEGRVPFHLATCSYSLCCIKLLLKTVDHLTNQDSSRRTRFCLLINNIPSARELLNELFNEHVTETKHRSHEADFAVSFDYTILLKPNTDVFQCSLVSELTTSSYMEELLSHPLLESFLFVKWNRIRPFFYTHFVVYVLFLILHTFYVLLTFGNNGKDWSQAITMLSAFRAFHLIVFLLILIPDLIFMLANFVKYVKQYETYVKLIALCTSAYIVFSPKVETPGLMTIERHVAAVSAFFSWVELMMLLGRFPVFGVYILMFTKVAQSIIKFLFSFSSLLVGFAIAFQILFPTLKEFKTFPASFVKTLMMMIGEIDYGAIVEEGGMSNSVLGYIFLVAFLFLVPILMANLLIGLAVSDIPDLSRQGKIKRLSKQASYLTAYELLILFFKEFKCFPRYVRTVLARRVEIRDKMSYYPNKRNFRQNSWWSRWSPQISSETLQAASQIVQKRYTGNVDDFDEESQNNSPKPERTITKRNENRVEFLRSLSIVSKTTNQDSESATKLQETYELFAKEYKRDFRNLKTYIKSHMSDHASPRLPLGSPRYYSPAASKLPTPSTDTKSNEDIGLRVAKLEQLIKEQKQCHEGAPR